MPRDSREPFARDDNEPDRASLGQESEGDAERSLVEGLKRGDANAVTELLERTHRPVFWMSCRLTKDEELRQDWTHDVLLRILEEMRRGHFIYRWPGCFWAWFRKRAHFLLLNLYNREKRQGQRQLTGPGAEPHLERAEAVNSLTPSQTAENSEIRSAIERCIEQLGRVEHQRAYTLVLFDQYTYEDVAQALEAPLNTVRSWIRRARLAVRRCMEATLDGGT